MRFAPNCLKMGHKEYRDMAQQMVGLCGLPPLRKNQLDLAGAGRSPAPRSEFRSNIHRMHLVVSGRPSQSIA
jgi:hypothetical protein